MLAAAKSSNAAAKPSYLPHTGQAEPVHDTNTDVRFGNLMPAHAGAENNFGDTSMNTLKTTLLSLWRDDEGLTMVEYAIAGALIAAGCAAAFTSLGSAVSNFISYLATLIVTP